MKATIVGCGILILASLLLFGSYVLRSSTSAEHEQIENQVSITGTVSNNGRYSLSDKKGFRLSELVAMAGYNEARSAVTHVTLYRRANEGARLVFHRNLAAMLSGKESDVVLKPQDAVCMGEVEPAESTCPRETPQFQFGPEVELVVSDDNAERDMFIDFDMERLLTPPEQSIGRDRLAMRRWMSANGVDAVGETTPGEHGLVGFDMVAHSVDDHYWDLDADAVCDCLLIKSYEFPVLLNGADKRPATFLFKTREHGMGVLQIIGFTDKPEGVRIRYKLMAKAKKRTGKPVLPEE